MCNWTENYRDHWDYMMKVEKNKMSDNKKVKIDISPTIKVKIKEKSPEPKKGKK